MTRIHILIEAGRELTLDGSHFYKVAVGSSQQADRDFLFLLAYAADHNFYFEVQSAKTTAFLNKIAESLNTDYLPLVSVRARDLVRSIKANTRLPLSSAALASAYHLRAVTNLDFRAAAAISATRRG